MTHVRIVLRAIGYAIALFPLLLSISLYGLGIAGPTLLAMSPELDQDTAAVGQRWYGVGSLPPRIWETMANPKCRWVFSGCFAAWAPRPCQDGDGKIMAGFQRNGAGVLNVQTGEYIMATGREGVAIALPAIDKRHARRSPPIVGWLECWLVVPHWFLLTAALITSAYCLFALRGGPLFWWHWLRRRLRQRAGLCESCGYNLYGLIECRCPECGSAFQINR